MPKFDVNVYVDTFGETFSFVIEADSKEQAKVEAFRRAQKKISKYVARTVEDVGYDTDADVTERQPKKRKS